MPEQSKDAIRQEASVMGQTDLERGVIAALALFQQGYDVDEKCPRCCSLIKIEGRSAGRDTRSAWISKCGCGACNSSFRGL